MALALAAQSNKLENKLTVLPRRVHRRCSAVQLSSASAQHGLPGEYDRWSVLFSVLRVKRSHTSGVVVDGGAAAASTATLVFVYLCFLVTLVRLSV